MASNDATMCPNIEYVLLFHMCDESTWTSKEDSETLSTLCLCSAEAIAMVCDLASVVDPVNVHTEIRCEHTLE